MTHRTCSIGGCGRKHKGRGLCQAHLVRLRKYGSTESDRPVRPQSRPLKERFWEKVDKTSGCWLWTGALTDGYGQISVGQNMVKLAHRLSYEWVKGAIPDGLAIDHMCHTRRCVNPAHLRLATWKQNAENPSGLRADNTSGVRGVVWDRKSRKWVGVVGHLRKSHRIGSFETIEEAEAAVVAKRNEWFTHNLKDRQVG